MLVSLNFRSQEHDEDDATQRKKHVDPDLYMQCYVSYLFNVMYRIYSSSPTFSTQEQKKQKSREWQRAYRQKIKNSIHGAE